MINQNKYKKNKLTLNKIKNNFKNKFKTKFKNKKNLNNIKI